LLFVAARDRASGKRNKQLRQRDWVNLGENFIEGDAPFFMMEWKIKMTKCLAAQIKA